MLRLNQCLTPLFICRTRENVNSVQYIGYIQVYVFGIRIAKIQETRPY